MSPVNRTTYLDFGAGASYVTAGQHALVEPLVNIGDEVTKGQRVALLRNPYALEKSPVAAVSPSAGLVVVRRSFALVRPGDHLFCIAAELRDGPYLPS